MHSTGPNSCSLTYLAQVDPKGNLCCWTCGVVMQILVTVEIWLISQECIYITRHYSVPDPLVNVNASACYQSCWILGRNRATFWRNNFWFSPQHLLGSLPKWVVNKASQYLVPQVSAAFLWCVCQVPPHQLEHRAEESGCPWQRSCTRNVHRGSPQCGSTFCQPYQSGSWLIHIRSQREVNNATIPVSACAVSCLTSAVHLNGTSRLGSFWSS